MDFSAENFDESVLLPDLGLDIDFDVPDFDIESGLRPYSSLTQTSGYKTVTPICMPEAWPKVDYSVLNEIYQVNGEPEEYCETVAVENSSIVAQIVGKNGSKIKHLIRRYNCHIQSPARDQEPVFVIKGKKEDVLKIKQELFLAAQHFTHIARTKEERILMTMANRDAVSVRLFIPERFIGLIVGRCGRTVRDLQNRYNVYIDTPRANISTHFQVYGAVRNINQAIVSISKLMQDRTGIEFDIKFDEDVHIQPKQLCVPESLAPLPAISEPAEPFHKPSIDFDFRL